MNLYEKQYQYFLQNRNKAYQVLNVGEKPRDKNIFSVKAANDYDSKYSYQS